ncbi:MAG TPA: DUF3570 domain-containing protein [Kofleriaceae bacterium]|jgi:hypothetical protein
MRLQLIAAAWVVASLACLGGIARADGTITERDVYYKERSTRVIQPILDGMFDAGERGLVTTHVLVDAITSASAGAGASNGVAFSKTREEFGAGYIHELDGPHDSFVDKIRVGGDAKYSTENDYTSLYGGARVEADLAQKNATVGLGVGYSGDNSDNSGAQGPMGGPPLVCDSDRPTVTAPSCHLGTFVFNATASQIISRNALVGIMYDLQRIHGFQSNPYRTVVTEDGLLPESHPDERLRQSVTASARFYVPATHTAFIPSYRFYWDNWSIHAHAPELRIVQDVGQYADASVAYRYYHQTASYFYEQRYGEIDPTAVHFITDDPKMSAFDGDMMQAKLGVAGAEFGFGGNWAAARFEGILSYIIQHNRFGNAGEAQFAITYPFNY